MAAREGYLDQTEYRVQLAGEVGSTQSTIPVEDLLCIQPEERVEDLHCITQNGTETLFVNSTQNVESINLTREDLSVFLDTSSKSQPHSSLAQQDQFNNILLSIRDLRADIRDELREFRDEFREMRDCIQMCTKKIDNLEGQLGQISDMVRLNGKTESVVEIAQTESNQKAKGAEKANPGGEQKASLKAVVVKIDFAKAKKPDATTSQSTHVTIVPRTTTVCDFEAYVKKLPINTVLQDIHKHFIAIKDDDFKQYFKVFQSVFNEVLKVMRNTDEYFNRYSSKIQFAGSHYDKLKVGKPNEFDMDVVIRLPISKKFDSDDVKLEATQPGFVMMKMGEQFLNLKMKPDWETHHKVTNDWCDKEDFLLQSSLRKWIEAIVQKALNKFERNDYGETIVKVDDVAYTIRITKSGPAFTMRLQNREDKKFKLDIDLVPVIEFELPRWPVGHRGPPESAKKKGWFVVPKPMKSIENEDERNRHWRLAFQDQEREVMEGLNNMKPTIRLLKKLRDSLELNDLASYYIKTLFLWESENTKENKEFWKGNLAFLFHHMVKKLHEALVNKSIPYYWNKKFNLIQCLEGKMQAYEKKVKSILDAIDEKDNFKVAKSLLTQEEFKEFKAIKST